MRRGLSLVLAALVAVALIGAPTLSVAQLQLNTYPGNIVTLAPTQVSVTNTTTATTLFSYSVPARLFQQFRQPLPGGSSLHLQLIGTLGTNVSSGGVGNANLGCNYGGSTATIALVNAVAFTPNISAVPLTIDLWLRRQGTGLATPVLQGRFGVVQTAGTETVHAASVIGTTSLASAQTLTCAWQWASASTTNTLLINHGTLVVGE